MQKLAGERRLPDWLAGAAVLTVLAGLLLYWEVSGGLTGIWITSPTGVAVTLGGLLGVVAAGIGVGIAAPATRRTVALAREIQATEGSPSPGQAGRLAALQRRSTLGMRWVAILAAVAAAAMAVAEYL
jgi:hypothetical protein